MAWPGAEEFFTSDILEFLASSPLPLAEPHPPEPVHFEPPLPRPRKEQPTSFVSVSDTDIERLKEKNSNKNTTRSTNTWAKRFQKWQEERGLQVGPSTGTEPGELDRILQRFFAEIRKEDGTEYEPDSLRTMLASLDRYFKEEGYPYRILKDKEFEAARKVLNGYAIELRERGKGKRKMRADPLTESDETVLWEKGILGGNNPQSLNYTTFYLLSQHFGTRGCQEHHQVRIEDLKSADGSGTTEYIEWTEGQTKTRQGGLTKSNRRVTQRVFATGGERCTVMFIDKLISKRPPLLQHTGPLYLRPLARFNPEDNVWFSSQPVGVNTINTYMAKMAELAGLNKTNKRFTNHSVRKTTVRKLQKAGVPPSKITAITGHKNQQSLADYTEMDLEEHCETSAVFSGKPLHDSTNLAVRKDHLHSLSPLASDTSQASPFQLPSLPQYTSHSTQPMPVYNFSNCNVCFSSSSSSASLNRSVSTVYKRKRALIESDSDSDCN